MPGEFVLPQQWADGERLRLVFKPHTEFPLCFARPCPSGLCHPGRLGVDLRQLRQLREVRELSVEAVLAVVVEGRVERGAGRGLEGLVELVEDGEEEDREAGCEAAGDDDQNVGQIVRVSITALTRRLGLQRFSYHALLVSREDLHQAGGGGGPQWWRARGSLRHGRLCSCSSPARQQGGLVNTGECCSQHRGGVGVTGPPSLPQPPLQPVLPPTDEVEGHSVGQEAAGLPGPAHLAHILPHHQVSTAPTQGPPTHHLSC